MAARTSPPRPATTALWPEPRSRVLVRSADPSALPVRVWWFPREVPPWSPGSTPCSPSNPLWRRNDGLHAAGRGTPGRPRPFPARRQGSRARPGCRRAESGRGIPGRSCGRSLRARSRAGASPRAGTPSAPRRTFGGPVASDHEVVGLARDGTEIREDVWRITSTTSRIRRESTRAQTSRASIVPRPSTWRNRFLVREVRTRVPLTEAGSVQPQLRSVWACGA